MRASSPSVTSPPVCARLAFATPAALAGTRAATDLRPGEDVGPAAVDDGTAGWRAGPAGERVAELVAAARRR